MKVIDGFLFFNEFDILKLRLEYLKDVVDYFVISECNCTSLGKPKPYYLDDIIDQFDDELKSKIIRLKYEPNIEEYDFSNKDECNFESGFCKLKRAQRDHIRKGLFQFAFEDIFMLSDADVIPKKELIVYMKENASKESFVTVMGENFKTYENDTRTGTVFTTVGNALQKGCNYLRETCSSFPFA